MLKSGCHDNERHESAYRTEAHQMDIEKAEALYKALWNHLLSLNDKDLTIQANNARDAVNALAAADNDDEKEEIIKAYYRILYPSGRGGLSDVVIWSEDYDSRIALNEPIAITKLELWKIINSASLNPAANSSRSADSAEKKTGIKGADSSYERKAAF